MRTQNLTRFAPLALGITLLALAGVRAATTTAATAQTTPRPVKTPRYVWRSVTVGAGGFIPGIVFSPVERGLAFLRSDMGGAYRWEAGAKTWVPMHDQFAESGYFGTESIAADPIDANTVYLAVGMYRNDPPAILRSRDKGKTWKAFPVGFHMGGNEDGRGLGERLAVDPNDNRILYFGSRHDGLQRSTDSGETWRKVAGFPLAGRGLPATGPTNGGLSFVIFDGATGRRGAATQTIFVGATDAGSAHLYRSTDAGKTWQAVAGEPKTEYLPAKAALDSRGILYIAYSNGIGPNGVTDGAVMRLDTHTLAWTDITPDKRPDRPSGGYMGISVDRERPGTLGVATMNRWGPTDTIWRTTDDGKTWADIAGRSARDVHETPYLTWGAKEARLGWWMSAFAIDPFDSDFAVYATGATVYATHRFTDVSKPGATTTWFPWVSGIEQTAVITLMSPSAGAPLLSGFGDIGGFVHDDLAVSPPRGMYLNPQFGNTNTLDYAGLAPQIVVRSGRPSNGQAAFGFSVDGGEHWQPISLPPAPPVTPAPPAGAGARRGRGRPAETPALITAADGKTFLVMTATPQITRDSGATWTPVDGLPGGAHPVADRVNPAKFYALDFAGGKLFTSTDGGATFAEKATTGLPADISGDRPNGAESPFPLHATDNKEGDLWFVSKAGLFHSGDGGASFTRTGGDVQVEALSFGKAPSGKTYPALFALGRRGDTRAIWRSDDAGASWIRVNDAAHQWGTRFRCIAGDPRVFGRVYVGTDGRGILYGEPAG